MTGTDILRWRRLKQRLGTALLPLIGIYSGFYHLDLTFPTDRVCLRKLIERSVKNCDARRKSNLSDTSQNGNWTCFRNELHYDRPEARINPKFFYPMPERAKLEFDFININRPDSQVSELNTKLIYICSANATQYRCSVCSVACSVLCVLCGLPWNFSYFGNFTGNYVL